MGITVIITKGAKPALAAHLSGCRHLNFNSEVVWEDTGAHPDEAMAILAEAKGLCDGEDFDWATRVAACIK